MSGWTEAPTLQGRLVRLEPLSPEHAEGWRRHYDPQVFAFLSRGAPEDGSLAELRAYIGRLNAEPNRVNWAVLVGGEVAGRISYSEVRAAHRGVEIGTMLMTPFQGGVANPESKYLLIRRAFEDLGALRVQFKVDLRNERSQRALDKLGAVREGVLRKYQIRPDGYARDSAMYSVIAEEWPEVKARLEARLEAFSAP